MLRCWMPTPIFLHRLFLSFISMGASQVALVIKNQPANAGDVREWVQSLSREDHLEKGMATQLKYSHLENPMERVDWRATVHKRLSTHIFTEKVSHFFLDGQVGEMKRRSGDFFTTITLSRRNITCDLLRYCFWK